MTMQPLGLEVILSLFESEGHPPMVRLMKAIKSQSWAGQLTFDSSMLRLLVARSGKHRAEILITYADGRDGGRPISDLDIFDVRIWETGEDYRSLSSEDAVACLARWLERH